MNWNDFNDVGEQKGFALIPQGTIAKVKMYIKRGGYNNSEMGLSDDLATQNKETGSVCLKVEYHVLEGEYTSRHIFGMIGLHSEKGETWGRMGRELINGILSSARGVGIRDNSERAKQSRKIESLVDLDGIGFLARIDVEVDQKGKERNCIKYAITCDHKDYERLMRPNKTAANAPATPKENFYWAG